MSRASSLLESMRKCAVQQRDHRGVFLTHSSPAPPSSSSSLHGEGGKTSWRILIKEKKKKPEVNKHFYKLNNLTVLEKF